MTTLLDANVLIAIAVDEHVHFPSAERWMAELADNFATCPMTQGALVRTVLRAPGGRVTDAKALLQRLSSDGRHEFWPDDVPYLRVRFGGVIGHRQVTDSYLAELARSHGGRVATFDQGFAALHGDVADLVPVAG